MENLEFDKHLKKAITAEERKQQKQYLKSIEASLKIDNNRKKFNWRIAASILLLIGLGSYFVFFNQSLSNNELYTKYFYPYENVIEPIVRDQMKLTKKGEVFSLYERGAYEKAIEGFNQLLSQNSFDVATLNFYKANAYLQLKEYEKAQPLFAKIVANKNKEWQAESLWYLGLISLKLNEVADAKKYFEELKNQPFKNKEVNDLLDKLQ